jgi:hypothetical protein
MNLLEKFTFICYRWIFDLLRNFTIFKSSEEEWNKFFACFVPIFAPLVGCLAISKMIFSDIFYC